MDRMTLNYPINTEIVRVRLQVDYMGRCLVQDINAHDAAFILERLREARPGMVAERVKVPSLICQEAEPGENGLLCHLGEAWLFYTAEKADLYSPSYRRWLETKWAEQEGQVPDIFGD